MDTKLKKSSSFGAWLAFFASISMLIFLFCLGSILLIDGNSRAIVKSGFFTEEKESSFFKYAVNTTFQDLLNQVLHGDSSSSAIAGDNNNETRLNFYSPMNLDSVNAVYYGKNSATGYEFGQMQEGNEVYDYRLFLAQGKLSIYLADQEILMIEGQQMAGELTGYEGLLHSFQNYQRDYPDFDRLTLNLAVAKNIVPVSGYSPFYNALRQNQIAQGFQIAVLVIIILSLVLFIYSLYRRKTVQGFADQIGGFLGHIWIEFKLFFFFGISFFDMVFIDQVNRYGGGNLEVALILAIAFNIAFWSLWLLVTDLRVNRSHFFKHNTVNSMLKVWKRFEKGMPLQNVLNKRFLVLTVTMLGMFFTALLFLMIAPPLSLIIFLTALYILYRYYEKMRQTTEDLGALVGGIRKIRQGEIQPLIPVSPDSDLYPAACDLKGISDGMAQAVEERVKAEKLKVDLITNVSHDLKTPLTSLISYIDILQAEPDLPDHVKDYINILSQKSERLSSMIRDVFEVSKAGSGNLEVEIKPLDLVRLTEQTLADMQGAIENSELTFKLNLKNQPLGIAGDGNRLYRALQNLINNALKYGMPGTRVYVDLHSDAKEAFLTIRNIASYEMNCKQEEIVERFVRGDQARSSEGSGLGLAIAKSFIEACGGKLSVQIDGDLFKVIVSFALIAEEELRNNNLYLSKEAAFSHDPVETTGELAVP